MRFAHIAWLALLTLAQPQTSPAADQRFDGSARLRPPQSSSADQRFALSAELTPKRTGDAHAEPARFQLNAKLAPPAALMTTACTMVDLLFKNGFEN